jgi:folate-binding protein YgfZ
VLLELDSAAASAQAIDTRWCALDARGLLKIDGEDAEVFLQGQLTQDMARVRAGEFLLAAHCSAKGRVTALFRAWHDGTGFLLDCPAELEAAALRRLRLYVLRSRVRIESAAARWSRTGVFGPDGSALLSRLGIAVPDGPGALLRSGPHWCTALGGERWLICSAAEDGAALRSGVAALGAEDPAGWALASVRAGDPEVVESTVDAFIPQMLNLDQLEGVSFRKGCYTGQEIVARTHYLGRVKRRMRRFAYFGPEVPQAGTQLPIGSPPADGLSAAAVPAPEAAQAQVVWAVQTGPAGGEVLAVAQAGESADPASAALAGA